MKVFTVSQINKLIKDLIDNEIILEDVTVTGELSSFSVTRNIAYFTLKDNDNLLSCVQFGAKQQFNIGDMVQCRGNVKYYPKGGKLSLNVISIEQCGQGELYQQFLALKEKLGKEGLFDEINKKPLPRFINSIGVVTSATGAVLQDIRNVTSRRNPNLDIYVYDAQVQGKFAVEQVIEGITYFDNYTDVDVIVVARGGGSIEDLAPFNDEKLARIAYICNKPLISAVGHETDWTLADAAADLRAPTPSAAAELAVPDVQHLMQTVQELGRRQEAAVIRIFQQKEQELRRMQDKLLLASPQQRQQAAQLELQHIRERLEHGINRTLERCSTQLMQQAERLDMLSPLKILGRGYALVYHGEDLIHSGAQVQTGDLLRIQLAQESVYARVAEEKEGTGHGI